MHTKGLKPGDKLIWDAPGMRGRIYYPVTMGFNSPPNTLLKLYMKHSDTQGSWIIWDEFEYLRWPTEEELQTITWPKAELLT